MTERGTGKTGRGFSDADGRKILHAVFEILERGADAEIRNTKGGVSVIESRRKIRERVTIGDGD